MINNNSISVIYPSRGRPEMFKQTINKWMDSCRKYEKVEWIISLDSDDPSLSKYLEYMPVMSITEINKNRSCVDAINNGASMSTNDLIVVISDDFEPFDCWDYILVDELYGKEDFIAKTQDGLQKTLITLPIMDRVYYERFEYIYHPDYQHMHCDEEMTIVGHMLGKVITLDLLFPHNHYTTGKMQMDAINVKNNSTWAHGQCTLDRRAKDNFGIVNPMVQRGDIVWK